MSGADLVMPMTRNYDMRVLEHGPLWMWSDVYLYIVDRGLHGVLLRANWTDPRTEYLWGLSFGARTVYIARGLEDARQARDEWNTWISAARLLAGVGRA